MTRVMSEFDTIVAGYEDREWNYRRFRNQRELILVLAAFFIGLVLGGLVFAPFV